MAAGLSDDHNARRPLCQAAVLAGVACALVLGGCSASLGTDPIATGTIAAPPPSPALVQAKDTDWDTVRKVVAKTPTTSRNRVGWQNGETGNSGTISDVIASSHAGKSCRHFSTTLSAVDGVRAYKAEVCREKTGGWEFTNLEPVDEGLDAAGPKG